MYIRYKYIESFLGNMILDIMKDIPIISTYLVILFLNLNYKLKKDLTQHIKFVFIDRSIYENKCYYIACSHVCVREKVL